MKRLIVTHRLDDYHAEIEGTEAWRVGKTMYEAIGRLVHDYPKLFDLTLVEDEE